MSDNASLQLATITFFVIVVYIYVQNVLGKDLEKYVLCRDYIFSISSNIGKWISCDVF